MGALTINFHQLCRADFADDFLMGISGYAHSALKRRLRGIRHISGSLEISVTSTCTSLEIIPEIGTLAQSINRLVGAS
jgi:hypothetical protein